MDTAPKNRFRAVTAGTILSLQSIDANTALAQTRPMRHRRPNSFGSRAASLALIAALGAAGSLACATVARAGTPDAKTKPLGSIEETARAHLDRMAAFHGADIYPGDVVETDTGGALHLRLGSGQLYLSASSSASLEQRGAVASVTLAKGSARFSWPDPLYFELKTPVGTLRGSGTHASSGQVIIFNPQQIVVTASRGDLVLESDADFYVIPEGKSYRVVIEEGASESKAAHGARRQGPAQRKLLFFPIATTGSVAEVIP